MVDGLVGDGGRYLAVLIVCSVIAIVATALRMWCKAATMKSGFQSFHADDWAILATTITYLAATTPIYWGKRCRQTTTKGQALTFCHSVTGLFEGSHGMEMADIVADLMASPSVEKLHRMENYLEVRLPMIRYNVLSSTR